MLVLLPLLACSTPSGVDTRSLDVAERLGPGEARAGLVSSEEALFGGVSAEGQVGDVKIYNDRVQFIVQAPRPGSFYVGYGGGVIDADIVRGEGEPGRDAIDEFGTMAGFGRLMEAERVAVVSDGRGGLPAVVRVEGPGAPMLLLTGSMEAPELVPDRDVRFQTDYILQPDSWLLEVRTTLSWNDEDTTVQVGDLIMLSFDTMPTWLPGRGLDGDMPEQMAFVAAIGARDEVALALMAGPGEVYEPSGVLDMLSELAPLLTAFSDNQVLSNGDELVMQRYFGVAPDLGTLSDAWYAIQGIETETVAGRVTADGEAVAGARAHVLGTDGMPITMAHADADGRFSVQAPTGTATEVVATGRGNGLDCDLVPGSGWMSPYAADAIDAVVLDSFTGGATPIPFAEGYGISESLDVGEDVTLELTAPAILAVSTSDGGPAVALVSFAEGDPVAEQPALVPSRPGGMARVIFIRDGQADIAVEPGSYDLLVHRGVRHEVYEASLSVEAGERVELTAELVEAYALPGVLVADPHSHAAPSGDGEISMSDRLVTHAANGVQVHFGTDHDHVADYRPLLVPLGLDGVMTSIVSDEVSPVMRGHHNVYPLEEVPQLPNNGAVAWWEEQVDTSVLYDQMLAMGEDVIIQVNHPTDSGMFQAAGYDGNGGVDRADHWDDRFEAVEVLNSGHHTDYFPYYLDLVNRGLLVTPVGVSDAHGHRGSVGRNVTFLYAGTSDPSELSNDRLRQSMRARATVASTGPFIEATIDGAWAPGREVAGPVELEVGVWTPSWMPVDTLVLYANGEVEQVVSIDGEAPERLRTTFDLDPDSDTAYVLEVSGSEPCAGAFPGDLAWAAASAVLIDADGGGWDPPLPSLSVGR